MKKLAHFMKLAWTVSPAYVILLFVQSVLSAAKNLCNVILPMFLVNELTGDKIPERLILFAALIVANNVGMTLIDNVFNLVTKPKCYHKPRYEAVREALETMREIMDINATTKIAMPRIGCGLDRLDWDEVYEIICEVFEDTDVEVLICEL